MHPLDQSDDLGIVFSAWLGLGRDIDLKTIDPLMFLVSSILHPLDE